MRLLNVLEPGDRFQTINETNSVVAEYIVLDDGTVVEYQQCEYTHSHTRHWCGRPQCRAS